MNKYIQCMKSNNKNNIRLYTILFLLCYMVIEINNYKNNNFLKYVIIIILILILVWCDKFNYKREDISVTSYKLLNDYNNDLYKSDKKYNGKYVKLTGKLKLLMKKIYTYYLNRKMISLLLLIVLL